MEQWEIDLRKQLENTPKKPKENKKVVPPIRQEKSSLPSVAILLLIIALFLALNWKLDLVGQFWKADFSQYWPKSEIKKEIPVEKKIESEKKAVPPTLSVAEKIELRKMRLEIEKLRIENEQKYEELKNKFQKNVDQIKLLGVLNNENWLVLRNQGVNSTDFIFFNTDWTINKMPQYLIMTAEDRAFLEKHKK